MWANLIPFRLTATIVVLVSWVPPSQSSDGMAMNGLVTTMWRLSSEPLLQCPSFYPPALGMSASNLLTRNRISSRFNGFLAASESLIVPCASRMPEEAATKREISLRVEKYEVC